MNKVLTLLLLSVCILFPFHYSEAAGNKSLVGQPLPALKVKWLKNPAPDLKGKPLIVEFWATWCPPCRQSIPHLNGIYKKYQSRGLEIVGITNEEKGTVKNFLKTLPINYNVAFEDEGSKSLSAQFDVTTIPYAVLVNKAGSIVWEGHPMSLQDSQIEELLK